MAFLLVRVGPRPGRGCETRPAGAWRVWCRALGRFDGLRRERQVWEWRLAEERAAGPGDLLGLAGDLAVVDGRVAGVGGREVCTASAPRSHRSRAEGLDVGVQLDDRHAVDLVDAVAGCHGVLLLAFLGSKRYGRST